MIDCKLSWPVITDFLISSQYEALPQVLKSLVRTFCQGNTYSRQHVKCSMSTVQTVQLDTDVLSLRYFVMILNKVS